MWIVIKVPWWAKPLIIIGAFLAVTADDYLGRRKLEKMCQEQGGLHIYKTVDNVEGFEIQYWLEKEPWLTKYNFNYIEKKSGTKIERLTKKADGKFIKEEPSKMKSEYKLVYSKDLTGDFNFFRDEIIRKADQKVMASYNYIGYKGGWVSKTIASLYASSSNVAKCSQIEHFDAEFWEKNITRVLKPKKEEK